MLTHHVPWWDSCRNVHVNIQSDTKWKRGGWQCWWRLHRGRCRGCQEIGHLQFIWRARLNSQPKKMTVSSASPSGLFGIGIIVINHGAIGKTTPIYRLVVVARLYWATMSLGGYFFIHAVRWQIFALLFCPAQISCLKIWLWHHHLWARGLIHRSILTHWIRVRYGGFFCVILLQSSIGRGRWL
jgi:hypothetical protein